MMCPLCGAPYEPEASASICRACPFGKHCALCRCGRCGYEWADRSRVVDWLRRRWPSGLSRRRAPLPPRRRRSNP